MGGSKWVSSFFGPTTSRRASERGFQSGATMNRDHDYSDVDQLARMTNTRAFSCFSSDPRKMSSCRRY
jgi:hypothetical protein